MLIFGAYLVFGEMMRMVERVVVRKLDSQGRISTPADWRAEWKSENVVLTWKKRKVEVAPMEPIDPTSLFDSVAVSDKVDFTDPHSLRKALLLRRKRQLV